MGKAVSTAFKVNLGICVIKTAAALATRSAGMTAEAVHSLADSGNQLLLMLGAKQAGKKADVLHPFGHGKEEYFWSFIVAMLLFVLGGAYSVFEGGHKIQHPEPLQHVYINLIILGVSALLEGRSWLVARRELRGTTRELFQHVIDSKDSSTVVVFVEDSAALIGLTLAFIGNMLSLMTGNPLYDAISSVVIGALLFVMALFLANEMRHLIVGETIDPDQLRQVKNIISAHPAVQAVGRIRTMQLGNNSCIIAVDIDFTDSLHDYELEEIMAELKSAIRRAVPTAEHIFLQLQKVDR